MSTSSAVINYRDTNNTALQKTVAGVNPNANSSQIVALAQGIIGLTDNTYGSTNRVDKSSCDGKTYYPITVDDPPVTLFSSLLGTPTAANALSTLKTPKPI